MYLLPKASLSREMSPSTSHWRSFPNYLTGPLSPASSTHPDHSPLQHSSSLPNSAAAAPAPIAMSFPVQSSYPYSFHDSQHIPLQPHVPVNAPFSYPSPDLDIQQMLDLPIPADILHDEPDSTHPPLLSHTERDHDPMLSPVSVNSFMTPCQSPVDMRSPLDYPAPTSLHSPVKGTFVHTILPSSFPENHVINFNVSVSFMSLNPLPLLSLSPPPQSLNSISAHVTNRRTPSQNAPRHLNPRKRTLMRPHFSNHKLALRNGASSLLVCMSVASAVQKLALVAKNPPAIPNLETLALVPLISLSKSRLSKRSCESTYRMSLSNRSSAFPDPTYLISLLILVQPAVTHTILSNP